MSSFTRAKKTLWLTCSSALMSAGLLSGCDVGCPQGYTRQGDACVRASSAGDSGAVQTSEESVSAKPDAGTSDGGARAEPEMGRAPEDGGKRELRPAPDAGAQAPDAAKPEQPTAAVGGKGGGAAPEGGRGGEPGPAAESGGAGSDSEPPTRPSFASGGGPVLKRPDIALLFWGADWTTSNPLTPGQVAGALQHMIAGPYFANLNQYGDIATPALTWVAIDDATALPGHAPSADEVASYINGRLAVNAAPTLGGDQLLVVVLPPGAVPDGSLGERGQASYNGVTYRHAWVAAGASINEAYSPSYSIARHVVHTMSNPDGNGWVDANSGKELTDVCGWTTISGVAHPQYWSNADARCVVPREYGSLLRYEGTPNTWSSVWKRVRMAACGGFGLVATDATDNIFKYNGQPDNWTVIGLPGAVHVVGTDTVFGLSPDLSGIYRYTGTETNWTLVGTQSINVYAGGFGVFATEIGSNRLKRWSGEGATWTDYGNPGAGFAVGADFIAGISLDHAGVFRSTSTINWAHINTGGVNQLFSAGNSTHLAATDRGTQLDNVYLYEAGRNWIPQGWPGYTFALTTDELFGLTPPRTGIFQSTDLSAPMPEWSGIGERVHNLVGGCDSTLYALRGLIQCDEGERGTNGSACPTTIGP
jgi:hypothetical protein